jgi:hypothetical protein
VSRAKLIAEAWDVGQMDSYDLGGFPPVWREWNGKYRDTMRDKTDTDVASRGPVVDVGDRQGRVPGQPRMAVVPRTRLRATGNSGGDVKSRSFGGQRLDSPVGGARGRPDAANGRARSTSTS